METKLVFLETSNKLNLVPEISATIKAYKNSVDEKTFKVTLSIFYFMQIEALVAMLPGAEEGLKNVHEKFQYVTEYLGDIASFPDPNKTLSDCVDKAIEFEKIRENYQYNFNKQLRSGEL